MTFEDLYTSRLNIELNTDSSNGVYASTNRQRAINDGYREFSALTECWVVRSTLAVSCNTAEVVLSTLSGFRRLHPSGPEYRLTSSGSTAVTTVLAGKDAFPRRDEVWLNTYQEGAHSTTAGTPTGWYLRNDGGRQFLGLDTPPDVGSSETCVLRVPYIADPDAMTASTSVPWSDTSGIRTDLVEYHQALVHFGASKLLPLVGDLDGAQRQVVLFMDYVKRFLGNIRPKGGTHVTMARNYLAQARRRGL
jgi:hypothetical protein